MFRIKKSVCWIVLLLATAWPVLAQDAKPETAKQPAAETSDPLVVPDGTPKELATYISGLVKGPRPRDANARKKTCTAILEAAEKLLAAKPSEPELSFAVQAKMNMLYMLEKSEQLPGFAAELAKAGYEKSARQVRGFMLQTQLNNMTATRNGPVQKSIDEAIKFLQEAPPEFSDVLLAHAVGMASEVGGDKELATKTYTTLAKIFAASENPRLVDFSKMLEGVTRRLNLVGQEMSLEGKVLGSGEDLDWSKYRGKVVLVQFWMSEATACVEEIRNAQTYYDLYHAKGFDVVGICVDRNPANVENFVKKNKIPWAIIVDAVKPNPAVAYYGVMNLPTAFLVGKDGKVVSLNARGEALGISLEKLLGSPEEKKQEPAKAKDK